MFNKIRLGVNGVGTLLWLVFFAQIYDNKNLGQDDGVASIVYALVILFPIAMLYVDHKKREGSQRFETASTILWVAFWGLVAAVYATTHASLGGWVGGSSVGAWFSSVALFLLSISSFAAAFSLHRLVRVFLKEHTEANRPQ